MKTKNGVSSQLLVKYVDDNFIIKGKEGLCIVAHFVMAYIILIADVTEARISIFPFE